MAPGLPTLKGPAARPAWLADKHLPSALHPVSLPLPGRARRVGEESWALRPRPSSARPAPPSHVLTSLKPLKSRGVGDLPAPLLRAASPCGQRAPPLAQVNPSTSLNSQHRDGMQLPLLTLQAEILNALHHPRASAHTRYHTLPGAVHALLWCSLSLDRGRLCSPPVPPAHPQQRNSPGPLVPSPPVHPAFPSFPLPPFSGLCLLL